MQLKEGGSSRDQLPTQSVFPAAIHAASAAAAAVAVISSSTAAVAVVAAAAATAVPPAAANPLGAAPTPLLVQ